MRCLSCQYDLSSLTEHRCPECGRAFDPKDANTFAITGKTKAIGLRRGALLCICGYGLNFVFFYWNRFHLIDWRDSTTPTEPELFWRTAFLSLLLLPIGAIIAMIAHDLFAKALRRWLL